MSLLSDLQFGAPKRSQPNFDAMKAILEELNDIIKEELEAEPTRAQLFNDFFLMHNLKSKVEKQDFVWSELDVIFDGAMVSFLDLILKEYEDEISLATINTIIMSKGCPFRIIPVEIRKRVKRKQGFTDQRLESFVIQKIGI